MDFKTALEVAGLAALVLGGFWKLNKSILDQFAALKESNTQSYHTIDVRLTGIETTVSPYAQSIARLQSQQADNVIKITKLEAIEADVRRLERQLEALQKRT